MIVTQCCSINVHGPLNELFGLGRVALAIICTAHVAVGHGGVGVVLPQGGELDGQALAVVLQSFLIISLAIEDTAKTYIGMGLVCKEKGDTTQAKELVQRAVDIYRATLGDDHPRTKKWVDYLARIS